MILEKKDLAMQLDKTPFVAIYMITYNHGAFIEKAVESVMMQQTNFPYKLYIGEDRSTDNTREICLSLKEKYSDKMELFLHEKNVGAAANARQIFEACFASGAKYIALLEGDDYWTDAQKLQKQTDFLEDNSDYVLCFHKVEILQTDGKIVDDFLTVVPENHETIEDFAHLGNYIHTPSVVFRNIITALPFEFKEAIIGDFFLYMMLAEHGKLKYIEENMAVYRYGVGVFSNKSLVKTVKSTNRLFSCLLSYLHEDAIKKIILERQLKAIDVLEETVKNDYEEGFVLNNKFFRGFKYLLGNIGQPSKIAKKIRSKF